MDKEGFFESLHRATDTTKSKINGIYLAGSCLGPMAIQKAMNQGVAAAGAVMSDLIPGKKFEVQPITAEIHYDKCSGCKICVNLCPYKAISFHEETGKASINAVLCCGCGTCVAACPIDAIKGSHFTSKQIIAEIKGALN
jgi:heterodisulfide reductase subunit A